MDIDSEYRQVEMARLQTVGCQQMEHQVVASARELARLVVYFGHRFTEVLIQVEQLAPDDLAPEVQQQLINRLQQLTQELERLQDQAAWTIIGLVLTEKGETHPWNA